MTPNCEYLMFLLLSHSWKSIVSLTWSLFLVSSRKSQIKPTAGNLCPAMHTPKIVTSAELKIMGTRNNKFRHVNSSKFQIDEPKLTIIEKGAKSAVVLKKMMVKRGQSLLRLPIKNAVNYTQLKFEPQIAQVFNFQFLMLFHLLKRYMFHFIY